MYITSIKGGGEGEAMQTNLTSKSPKAETPINCAQ